MRFNRFSLLLIGCAMAQLVNAHEFEAGSLHIDHPWSRALPPVAPTGAAYLQISNQGEQSDTLLGADTPAAEKVEIHEHVHADGLMKMQRVDRLELAPGQTVTQSRPAGRLPANRYELTIQFEDAERSERVTTFTVE